MSRSEGITRRGVLGAVPAATLAAACAADDPLQFSAGEVVDSVTVGAALTPPAQIAPTDSIIPVMTALASLASVDADAGVATLMWGYRIAGDTDVTCGSPGPVIRGRVGDVMRVTMTNLIGNEHPHNIDFHAVTGQGGGAADLTAAPGESKTIEARLLYPGAFMYHCAFGDVPEHIVHGMYGMVIVDPETPLPPVDHEWSISQSEWYVSEPDDAGIAVFDRAALFDEEPRYVTFNGRTDALADDNALRMGIGERAHRPDPEHPHPRGPCTRPHLLQGSDRPGRRGGRRRPGDLLRGPVRGRCRAGGAPARWRRRRRRRGGRDRPGRHSRRGVGSRQCRDHLHAACRRGGRRLHGDVEQ